MKRATRKRNQTALCRLNFNPRPREEGDMSQSRENLLSFYFNPRPREEGDGLRGAFFINGDISIHALVKRATAYLYIKMQMRTVDFNPRPREEGD